MKPVLDPERLRGLPDAMELARRWLAGRGCGSPEHLEKHRLLATPRSAAAGLAQAAAVVDTHRALERAGLRHAFFKGPTLSVLLYGSATRRRSADVDLWVPRADLAKAVGALQQDGWRLDAGVDLRSRLRSKAENEVSLRRRGVVLDLHWDVYVRTALRPRGRAAVLQAGSAVVAGQAVPTFSGLSYLLYLVLHGARDAWKRLHWLADAAEWLRQRPADLQPLLALAQVSRVQAPVALFLELARRVGLPLEGPAAAPAVGRWADHIEEAWRSTEELPWPWGRRIRYRMFINGRGRGLASTAVFVFHPRVTDFASVRLPRPARGLYWVLRPVRLAAKLLRGGYAGRPPRRH